MMKKTLVILVALLILTLSVSAVEIQVKQFVPVLDGIISADEYPEDSWYVLDKATATAYNGIWTGEMTDDLQTKYNFAWAADGLYAAFVAVDNTPEPATTWDVHSQDGGPAADGFQYNTGGTWITIGAYADGTLAPRNHFGGGEEADGLANIVTGKATREGNVFTVEAFIPWEKLLNYEVAQDSVIPILFAYMDRADAADNVCYKSMDVGVWDATAGDNSLKLTAATYAPPVPEVVEETTAEAPAATDAPVVTAAPQTADAGIIIGLATLIAAGYTFISAKKKI